jgi:hypothetical protein
LSHITPLKSSNSSPLHNRSSLLSPQSTPVNMSSSSPPPPKQPTTSQPSPPANMSSSSPLPTSLSKSLLSSSTSLNMSSSPPSSPPPNFSASLTSSPPSDSSTSTSSYHEPFSYTHTPDSYYGRSLEVPSSTTSSATSEKNSRVRYMIKQFEEKGEMRLEVLGEDGKIRKVPRSDLLWYW